MAPRKRPWFRFYVEAVYDRKLRRLPPAQRWLWVVVLAMARQSPEPGTLLVAVGEPVTDEDLADAAGMRISDVRRGLSAMESIGLITKWEPFSPRVVVNWSARQYESDDVTSRTRRHRSTSTDTDNGTFHEVPMERSRNGDARADGTPPETETENRDRTPPSDSDSRPPTPADGGGGDVIEEAARILAKLEVDRRGAEIANPGGYLRSRTPAIRRDHEDAWHALLDHDPTTTAEQLVASLTRPTATETALDDTQRAGLALMQRDRSCPTCSGVGMAELDDGTYAPCPTCRPDDHRLATPQERTA